jgi:rubrerythrin
MTRTATQILGAATRIESLAQDIYTGLAVTFEHQPFLKELFGKLATEEGQHAMRIRLLDRHAGKAPWPADKLERIGADLDALAAEITVKQASFRKLHAASDAREVLRSLVEMELRFGSVHAEELARSGDPEVQKLFGALAQQDDRHRELIARALGAAGDGQKPS